MAWPKGRPRSPKPKPDSEVEEFGDVPVLDRIGTLKLEAEMIADRAGHALSDWQDEDGWAQAECTLCGGKVAVAPHPPIGRPFVQHEARFTIGCGK